MLMNQTWDIISIWQFQIIIIRINESDSKLKCSPWQYRTGEAEQCPRCANPSLLPAWVPLPPVGSDGIRWSPASWLRWFPCIAPWSEPRFACSFCTSNPVWNTNYRPGKYELLRPIRWKPWKHWILVVVFLQFNEQSQISQHKDGIAADTQKSFREAEPLLVSLDLLLG